MDAPATPFKGLAPFESSDIDALLFFGRDRERELIVANLLASRLTVLYGPVGVGKSSLLRAGVAHRLRQEVGPDGRPDYAVVVFDAWSDDPWASLRTAIDAELAGRDARETDVLLLVDQTEEYFLYHEREHGPGTFAGELPGLVTDPSLRMSVLLAIREDALARLDRFKGSIPNLFSNYLRLDHLDREEARAAILGPVDRYNRLAHERVEVEDALVDAVLDQTAVGQVDFGSGGAGRVAAEHDDQRIEAPYLQLVLRRLWDAERAEHSDTLRLATFEQLGGAEAIVRAHLERALADLDQRERDLAASVFRHLVTPSGAKIAHAVDDLAEYADVDAVELRPLVTKLVEERILRPVAAAGEGGNGVPHEIYHDVLGDAVLAWRTRHRAERALEGERRRRRRAVRAAALAVVALAFVAAIAVYALTQRSQARTAARHAHARELEETALAQLDTDPQRSLRLAVEAARLNPTQQAEDMLRRALIDSHERAALHTGGPVTAAMLSPDGRRILIASRDGKARIVDPKTFRVLHVLRHDAAVTSASYRRDGNVILTTSEDRTARLWDAQTGALVLTLRHLGAVLGATFGPDELLVTASADHRARVWNGVDGRLLRVLRNPGPVYVAVLNLRGTLAATVAEDEAGHRQARIFDARTGLLLRVLPEKGVIDTVFSPDGKLLVTTSTDKTARVWNAASGRLGARPPPPRACRERIVQSRRHATRDSERGRRRLRLGFRNRYETSASHRTDGSHQECVLQQRRPLHRDLEHRPNGPCLSGRQRPGVGRPDRPHRRRHGCIL